MIDDDVKALAYRLFSTGQTTAAGIHRGVKYFLRETGQEGRCPDVRTVRRWINKWREPQNIHLDLPFRLELLDECEISWDYAALLMKINKHYRRIERRVVDHRGSTHGVPKETTVFASFLTMREALWITRVDKIFGHDSGAEQRMPTDYVYDREFERQQDIANVGIYIALRELRAEVLGEPFQMADIQAWFEYRPWVGWPKDRRNGELYEKAINRGIIPPLPEEPFAYQEAELVLKERQISTLHIGDIYHWPIYWNKDTKGDLFPKWLLSSQHYHAMRKDHGAAPDSPISQGKKLTI